MLIHLISDMMRDRENLRERFSADAQAIFAEYELSPREIKLLRTRDALKIAEAVAREVKGFVRAFSKVHKEGPRVGPLGGPQMAGGPDMTPMSPFPWPVGLLTVRSIKPRAVTLGKSAHVIVTCSGLSAGSATLTFTRPNKISVRAMNVLVRKESETTSIIEGDTRFSGVPSGAYNVVVKQGVNEHVLAQGFTVNGAVSKRAESPQKARR